MEEDWYEERVEPKRLEKRRLAEVGDVVVKYEITPKGLSFLMDREGYLSHRSRGGGGLHRKVIRRCEILRSILQEDNDYMEWINSGDFDYLLEQGLVELGTA
jgi:hypothetical protein